MSTPRHAFDPQDTDRLPEVLPVFPLAGALLLPRAELPLNIFEPRYLTMVADSLSAGRMFGMVQPSETKSRGAQTPVYDTGCLGRISAFRETPDGRILLSLRGICRFKVAEELPVTTPYRQVKADYDAFVDDLAPCDDAGVRRKALLPMLRQYLDRHRMEVDWDCIEKAPSERLVNYLAMICPFDACEKQVLLEAATIDDRARVLMGLLQLPENGGADPAGRLQ